MTIFPKYIPQSDPPLPPWETLPTMYDLPSDNPDEPGLPDDFHFLQPLLLYLTFQPTNWKPEWEHPTFLNVIANATKWSVRVACRRL